MQPVPVFGFGPLGVEDEAPYGDLVKPVKEPSRKDPHGGAFGELPPVPRRPHVGQMGHIFEKGSRAPDEYRKEKRDGNAPKSGFGVLWR